MDIHNHAGRYEKKKEELLNSKDQNKDLILKFLYDAQLGKTIKDKSKKKIGVSRLLKYLSILTSLSQWFGKRFDQVTEKDMEDLIFKLETDQYRRKNGQPYSLNTKLDYKKAIRKYWKYLEGNGRTYPEKVEFIDTNKPLTEIPALSIEQVERMIEKTSRTRIKCLLMFLFDSGTRISECLQVRVCDLTEEEEYFKVRIRHETSKTRGRTISLPLTTKYLKQYLREKSPESTEFLFPFKYSNVVNTLRRVGNKALNRGVNPHLFRHSSATYYAQKLSHYQLAYRYGWSMASDMPKRYIDRSGIEEEKVADIIEADRVSKLSKENQRLTEDLSITKQRLMRLEQSMSTISKVMTVVMSNPELKSKVEQEAKHCVIKESELFVR